ncbi:MAG: FemAB family PEP-CTERM system-associated protein [Saprospiraceae bacterium]|nr:FemAB family PEP-CTERM system-associated protein [Nitrospira sp.]
MVIVDAPGHEKEWEEYVSSHPQAYHYHQWRWKAIIEQAFGHSTRYLIAREGETVHGVLPLTLMSSWLFGRFMVSVPFVNYGGLLVSTSAAAKALLEKAEAIAREIGARHIELRHIKPVGLGLQSKHHKVTLLLQLAQDVETQWKQFDCKLRNQIRKAEKSQLSTMLGREDCLEAFYAVFAQTMRDLGTPVYGKSFFASILEQFPTAKILLVNKEAATVAAGFMVSFRDTVEVPWAGSLKEYRPLCPNMLLYWEAMKWAMQGGFQTFDFGRSTPGEGTYRFKLQWGAVPIPLVWEYWMANQKKMPDLSPKNPKYQVAINLWKQLPLAVANQLGPVIVKNIP